MAYIILNWNSIDDVAIVTDTDGIPKSWDDRKKAERYAKNNMAFRWTVVEIN